MTTERLVKYFLIMVFMSFSAFSYAGNRQDFKPGRINPAFQAYIQGKTKAKEGISSASGEHKLGLIPNPFSLGKHKISPSSKTGLGIINLPSSYDLRNYNYVTPIKNQEDYGTCWAFATYGSLESDLLVENEPEDNFSENNLVNKSEFTDSVDGGNINESSAYLARGEGPVEASCDPYPNIGNSPDDCPRVQYIENIVFLPGRNSATDNEFLKLAVYEHGAVYTGMYWANGYYNDNDSTYYYNGTQHGNHAVVIVGWDDNMVVPGAPGKGAWIIRNSWGPSFGDSGYFYVSYYDTILASGVNAYFVDEPDINGGDFNIYQYDTLGMEGGYSCTNNKYVYGANVFTAHSTGKIEAVSLFAAAPTTYEISVYPYCSDPNNITRPPVDVETGVLSNAGFYTIKLKNHIVIDKGVSFCVVERLSQDDNESTPLGIEEHITGYSDNAVAEPGQSFISCDNGTTWSDLYTTFYKGMGATNVCLKAIYIAAEPIITSLLSCAPSTPCTAQDPQYVYVGDNVTFKSSISDDYPISAYEWNFGDGTKVTNDNGSVVHSYSKAGVYLVSLTVKDNNSNIEEKRLSVFVKPVGGDIRFAADPESEHSFLFLISYNSTIKKFTVESPDDAQNIGDIDMSTMPESISPEKVIIANLDLPKIGATATIKLTNLDIKDNSTFYKYANGKWTNLKDDNCDFKIIDNKTISFNVTDGGSLDNDGSINGQISDPIVIGMTTSIPPTPAPTGSSGGGCVASKNSSGMGLMLIVLTALAVVIKRKVFDDKIEK